MKTIMTKGVAQVLSPFDGVLPRFAERFERSYNQKTEWFTGRATAGSRGQ